MTTAPIARDLPPVLAVCSRCTDWIDSDRITVDQALSDGWAVLNGKLVCTDHLVPCTRCGDPCLLESDGCVRDGDWHCDECAGNCGECGRYEAAGREPYDD